MRPRPHARPLSILIACCILIVFGRSASQAALFENLAICAKGISLANTCTAYPPDQMSIHYNPAGLTNTHDGLQLSQGFMTAEFAISSRFKADPDYPGWLGGIHGEGYDFRTEADPVNGKKGTTQGVHLYLPLMGEADMDTVSMPTPFGFTLAAAPFPFAMSYRQPHSRWTFGFGLYAPAIGGYYRDDDDPARYNGRTVSMQLINYGAPAVSYQLTHTLSVGMTLGLGQAATQLNTDMRLPNDMMALTKILGLTTRDLNIPIISALTLPPPWFGGGIGPYDDVANLDLAVRDDYCPSYNLGLLWEPYNWFSFGLCYQSEVKMEQHGSYRFTYDESFQRMVAWMGSSPLLLAVSGMLDLPYQSTPYQQGNVYMEGLNSPQRIQAGIMLRPIRQLRLLCDVHWIDYSQTEEWTIIFDQDIQPLMIAKFVGHMDGDQRLSITQNMKDETHFSFGAELQVLKWLALRCGYEDRKTSINRDFFSLMAPVPDLDYYGVGLGINLKSGMKIDLAAGYIVSDKWTVKNNTSKNLNSTEFVDAVYNPYGGMDVSGKMEATILAANFSMPFKYVYSLGHILRDTYRFLGDVAEERLPFLTKPENRETGN